MLACEVCNARTGRVAGLDLVNKNGMTPLMQACASGNEVMVTYLVGLLVFQHAYVWVGVGEGAFEHV